MCVCFCYEMANNIVSCGVLESRTRALAQWSSCNVNTDLTTTARVILATMWLLPAQSLQGEHDLVSVTADTFQFIPQRISQL